jgi:predicted small lipoprotein YifL
MRLLHLSATLLSALLLASCGNNAPPAAPSSEVPTAQQAAATAPATDDSLTPLFGTWALDPAQCGGQVLKISRARFEGAENGCDISGYTDNGDGTYTAAMSCVSQGQTANESIKMRPVFAPTGEGIELTYVNRDNLASTVLRCPEPTPAN